VQLLLRQGGARRLMHFHQHQPCRPPIRSIASDQIGYGQRYLIDIQNAAIFGVNNRNQQSGVLMRTRCGTRRRWLGSNHMRPLIEPPRSLRCCHCGGELRLKQIESANPIIGLENRISVCAACDYEQISIVPRQSFPMSPRHGA
jgi:hypothetical protein